MQKWRNTVGLGLVACAAIGFSLGTPDGCNDSNGESGELAASSAYATDGGDAGDASGPTTEMETDLAAAVAKFGPELKRIRALRTSAAFQSDIETNRTKLTGLETQLFTRIPATPAGTLIRQLIICLNRADQSAGAALYQLAVVEKLKPLAVDAFSIVKAALEAVDLDPGSAIRLHYLRVVPYLVASATSQTYLASAMISPTLGLTTTRFAAMSPFAQQTYRAALHRAFIAIQPSGLEALKATNKLLDLLTTDTEKGRIVYQLVDTHPELKVEYYARKPTFSPGEP